MSVNPEAAKNPPKPELGSHAGGACIILSQARKGEKQSDRIFPVTAPHFMRKGPHDT
jgi:hypothetical protein